MTAAGLLVADTIAAQPTTGNTPATASAATTSNSSIRSTAAQPRTGASAPLLVQAAPSRPIWAQLTVQQQIALRPLSASWDNINEAQKRKWLELSKGYASLAPDEQTRMHSRMVEWVGMSPQARAQARLNFAKTKELSTTLSPDEKKAKWQTYQALSQDEKRRLAEKAAPKAIGAATAIKPVAPQRLTAVTEPALPRANRVELKITPLQPAGDR